MGRVAAAKADATLSARLATRVRAIPDFPQPGVVFRDVTPLLADARALAECVGALAAPWRGIALAAVCGIEARGFIFGAALASVLDTGFVPLRKAGKLPAATFGVDFQLEYGAARLEVHADALPVGVAVLIVDDVLATGGTLAAAYALVRKLGVRVAGAAVPIELDALKGRSRWPDGIPLRTLLHY